MADTENKGESNVYQELANAYAQDQDIRAQIEQAYLQNAREKGIEITPESVEKAVTEAMLDYIIDSEGKKAEPGQKLSQEEIARFLGNVDTAIVKARPEFKTRIIELSDARRIAAGLLLGVSAMTMLDSCKKDNNLPSPTTPAETRRGIVEIGNVAVYYSNDKDGLDEAANYKEVLVQPAFTKSGDIPHKADEQKKERVYMALGNLIPDSTGLHTSKLFREIAAITTDDAGNPIPDGFLHDKDKPGNPRLEDPTLGNTPIPVMADLRIKKVRDAVFRYYQELKAQGYEKFVIDGLDAYTSVENRNFSEPGKPFPSFVADATAPGGYKKFDNTYDGLTQAACQLFLDINRDASKGADGKLGESKVKTIGGLYQSLAYPNASTKETDIILRAIVENGCGMVIEGQYYQRAGVLQGQDANVWSRARFNALLDKMQEFNSYAPNVAQGLKRDHMDVTSLEPLDGSYESTIRKAGNFYGNLFKSVNRPDVKLNCDLFIGAVLPTGYFDFGQDKAFGPSTNAINALGENAKYIGKERDLGLAKADNTRVNLPFINRDERLRPMREGEYYAKKDDGSHEIKSWVDREADKQKNRTNDTQIG